MHVYIQVQPTNRGIVDGENFVGMGVAGDVEPASASGRVDPALKMRPFWIFTHEQIICPFSIAALFWIFRSLDVRFVAVRKLAFFAFAAEGAGEQKHLYSSMRDGGCAVFVDQMAGGEAFQ